MKLATTMASEMNNSGHRLDAGYHASDGVKALRFLKQWGQLPRNERTHERGIIREKAFSYGNHQVDLLGDVCRPGGIYIPGRFKRYYVNDPDYGERWMSPTDMLRPDLNGLSSVSKKHTPSIENLRIHKDWILLSRSGTIGNCAYVRQDMDGIIGSDDIIRVIVDETKILSGYLFAFLSSVVGRSLIEQQTYGAVVPHIETHHVWNMLIPRIGSSAEKHIHDLIVEACVLRVEANENLVNVRQSVESEVGFSNRKHAYEHQFSVGHSSIEFSFSHRLDAFAYAGYIKDALQTLKSYQGVKLKASKAGFRIYNPPIFKRMFAPTGHPYMSGVEIYTLRPSTNRYLSEKQPGIEQYLVSDGMVLIQSAGQRYGLITTPVFVTGLLDGVAATSDIVRVVHEDEIENGYICALFSSEFGRRLALRYSYGTSIPRIDVPKFAHIEIPWPDNDLRREIGCRTVEAYRKREEANLLEDKAQELLLETLGWEKS